MYPLTRGVGGCFPASPSTGSGQALDTALAGLLGIRRFYVFLTLSSRHIILTLSSRHIILTLSSRHIILTLSSRRRRRIEGRSWVCEAPLRRLDP